MLNYEDYKYNAVMVKELRHLKKWMCR